MKTAAMMILGSLVLLGCASTQEAYYVDREMYKATEDSLAQQIVYKDYRHAQKTPEDLFGNAAEEVMERFIETYSEGFTSEEIEITEIGIEE